jgi:hypothetical protein
MEQADSFRAQRLIENLSQAFHRLPSSLLIEGEVADRDPYPTCGGGYADVYRARHMDQPVALKVFIHGEEEASKVRSVSRPSRAPRTSLTEDSEILPRSPRLAEPARPSACFASNRDLSRCIFGFYGLSVDGQRHNFEPSHRDREGPCTSRQTG